MTLLPFVASVALAPSQTACAAARPSQEPQTPSDASTFRDPGDPPVAAGDDTSDAPLRHPVTLHRGSEVFDSDVGAAPSSPDEPEVGEGEMTRCGDAGDEECGEYVTTAPGSSGPVSRGGFGYYFHGGGG